MRISDWSSDVCSSDLWWAHDSSVGSFPIKYSTSGYSMAAEASHALSETGKNAPARARCKPMSLSYRTIAITGGAQGIGLATAHLVADLGGNPVLVDMNADTLAGACKAIGEERCLSLAGDVSDPSFARSEEHTSELQSLMRISYAVFCLKKKIQTYIIYTTYHVL